MERYIRVYKNRKKELKKDIDFQWHIFFILSWIIIPIFIIIDLFDKAFFRNPFWIKETDYYKEKIKELLREK